MDIRRNTYVRIHVPCYRISLISRTLNKLPKRMSASASRAVPILSVFDKILGKAFHGYFYFRIFNPVVKYVRGFRTT